MGAGFDSEERFIICEVNDFFQEEKILNLLLHEYMHLLDNIYSAAGIFDNTAWGKLNPPGTVYSRQGALGMIKENLEFITEEHPEEGFLNGYSLADVYQDKAEVFSYLFIAPYFRKAEEWMKTAPSADYSSQPDRLPGR